MKYNSKKSKLGMGGVLQALSPLLNLVPGGQFIAPVAGGIGALIEKNQQNKNQPYAGPPAQQNTNPYGFALGGLMGPGDPPVKKVTSKKDPAYKAYRDSLTLYKQGETDYNNLIKTLEKYNLDKAELGEYKKPRINGQKIQPKKSYRLQATGGGFDRDASGKTVDYNYYKQNNHEALKVISSAPLDGLSNIGTAIYRYQPPKQKVVVEKAPPFDPSSAMIPSNELVSTEPPKALPNRMIKKDGKLIPMNDLEYNLLLQESNNVGEIQKTGKVLDRNKFNLTNSNFFASGGYLNQTGPNTQEVIGNNPSQTDGVELPNAFVDHGETISQTADGKYVFSDKLMNPLTRNTFADDDKKLAQSDKKAASKPYDKEAQNTLKINQMQREKLAQLNEGMKTLMTSLKADKGMAKGGYMKPSYNTGGKVPWKNFDYNSFYDFVGRDNLSTTGFKMDSDWGQAHDKLWSSVGPEYQQHIGYNPTTKTFGIPPTQLPEGMSSVDYTTGRVMDSTLVNTMGFNPLTGKHSITPEMLNRQTARIDPDGKYMLNDESTFGGELQPLPQGGLSNTIKTRTSPFVNPYNETNTGKPTTTKDTPYPGREGIGNLLKDNAGTGLQVMGLLGQGATLLQKPERQKLYQNNAPINQQRYDAAPALNRSQYNFNALKTGLSNSVGDAARTSNLQQAFANKTMNEASIVNEYAQMNQQSQRDYETRLGQRQSENNQYKYTTDDLNSRNKAARDNSVRQFLSTLGGLGGEINNQKSNTQAVGWLLKAYPDLAPYIKEMGLKIK